MYLLHLNFHYRVREYLFYKMLSTYPKAQRFFLLIHKVTRENGVDCTITKNAAGYTQTELFDAIRKVCTLYNVKIIDVFSKSVINTAYQQYRSPVSYADDNTVTDREFVDKDGVHPLAYGYLHGYLPVVKQALQGGGESGISDDKKYVSYTQQELTKDQKAQARENIGVREAVLEMLVEFGIAPVLLGEQGAVLTDGNDAILINK